MYPLCNPFDPEQVTENVRNNIQVKTNTNFYQSLFKEKFYFEHCSLCHLAKVVGASEYTSSKCNASECLLF